jgi:hypothetical protein
MGVRGTSHTSFPRGLSPRKRRRAGIHYEETQTPRAVAGSAVPLAFHPGSVSALWSLKADILLARRA